MLRTAVEHYERQAALTLAALAQARRRSWRDATSIAQIVAAHQLAAAQDALDSIDPMLAEQGLQAVPTGLVVASSFAGVASDGRPLVSLLEQAVSPAALGLMVVNQVQDMGRAASAVSISSRPEVGYVRMISPGACSRCVILAGKFFRYNEGFLRHPRCSCRHVPSVENVAGDLTTDPNAYFESLTVAEQDRAFTKAGAEVIRQGADINQVVNARRVTSGMSFAGQSAVKRDARGNLFTTEGTTRRGLAAQQQAGLRVNGPVQQRLMPETILRRAKDREDAQRLLRLYGYISDPAAAARGRQIFAQARRDERIAAARARRAATRAVGSPARTAGAGSGDRPPAGRLVGGADDPDEYPQTNTGTPPPFTPSTRPKISRGSRNHILNQHRAGTANSRKTKFPAAWSDDEIMVAVDEVLARPAAVAHSGDKFTFEGVHRGLTIRVRVRVDKPLPFIWTAYPLPSQGVG